MLIAKNKNGKKCCAKCGKDNVNLVESRFLPTSCSHGVPSSINHIGVCGICKKLRNKEIIVLPSWYKHLTNEQKNNLARQMRYNRAYILRQDLDENVLNSFNKLMDRI